MNGNYVLQKVCSRSFCLAVVFLLLQASLVSAYQGVDIMKYKDNRSPDISFRGNVITCYGLTIKRNQRPVNKMADPDATSYKVYLGNKKVFEADNIEVAENFPKQNMATLVMNYYSGGATGCCYDYVLFTINAETHAIIVSDLSTGGRYADDGTGLFEKDGTIRSCMWNFTGYSTGDDKHHISMYPGIASCQPRLLVYENDGWRLDAPGEFKNFYAQRLAKVEKWFDEPISTKGDSPASLEVAYYSIMSGEPEATTRNRLKDFVSPLLIDGIYSDVREAIQDVSAVKNRPIENGKPGVAKQAAATTAKAMQQTLVSPAAAPPRTDNFSNTQPAIPQSAVGLVGNWKGEFQVANAHGKKYTAQYVYTLFTDPSAPAKLKFKQTDTLTFLNPLDMFSCTMTRSYTNSYTGDVEVNGSSVRFIQRTIVNSKCGSLGTDHYRLADDTLEAVDVNGGLIRRGNVRRY
jgi:hypothetical protein